MKIFESLTLNLVLLSFLTFSASAHDGHKKKSQHQDSSDVSINQDSISVQDPESHLHHIEDHDHDLMTEHSQDTTDVSAGFSDFPHLHPLVVHFPIVLLVISGFIQLFNVILPKKELDWVVTGILLVGFLGAYASVSYLHPHTSGLSDQATRVLELHDKWADWTVYFSGAALVIQVITQFRFRLRWLRIIVLSLAIGSGISVSLTGHYGAQLVHIEGVGPQGNYLSPDHTH